ncbi:MAG: YceH family protein [Candidatus Acidiferrales bacterium]
MLELLWKRVGILYPFCMDAPLTSVEVRILGALIEKEITTPEYYPLSLNALINACNQKSNREPVMSVDQDMARAALRSLGERGYAGPADNFDSRVTKYEHRLQEAFNFDRRETAILCELLLRGPQTPGELRSRCERMHKFDDLDEIQVTLQRLMKREPPLVKLLPKLPGTKESRYAHLLAGDVAAAPGANQESRRETHSLVAAQSTDVQRIAQLELEIATLREELSTLKTQFAEFKRQFQ